MNSDFHKDDFILLHNIKLDNHFNQKLVLH